MDVNAPTLGGTFTVDGEADVVGGNGEAVSASADSDDGAEESNDCVASDKVETDEKSVATRTPTPSEKRPRNATRTKQKNKTTMEMNANAKNANAITNAVQTTINTAKTKTTTTTTTTAAATTATTATTTIVPTTTTRSNNKQILTRSATPTANITATSTPIANNARGRKASLNNRFIYNNTHNTRGAAAATPTLSISSRPTSANADLANEGGEVDAEEALAATTTTTMLKPPLEPLQLVWAKCRGYPWYPALILDPKTPKGFVYNGVPLPAPPPDVLALRKNYTEDVVFLVLFFDVKRTWQWLPANKLEILGIDKRLDQQKLVESRKPTERKAVKKAYQDALHYQSQVSDLEGQGPDPIM